MTVKIDSRLPERKFRSRGPQKDRPSRCITTYPWKRRMAGKVGLIQMHCYLSEKVTDAELVLKRNFSTYIGNGTVLLEMLKEKNPAVVRDYKRVTGRDLSPNVCYNRINKMYLKNSSKKGEACKPAISMEHPSNSPYLQHYLPDVERRYRRGFVWKKTSLKKFFSRAKFDAVPLNERPTD